MDATIGVPIKAVKSVASHFTSFLTEKILEMKQEKKRGSKQWEGVEWFWRVQ